MKFFCRYFGIHWDLFEFDEIREIQATQCYITAMGVNHELKCVDPRGSKTEGESDE